MRSKGFSLIEITIAIVILAILLSLSITVFAPQKVKYDNYASSLTNLLFRAKNAAIFNLYNVVVIYNTRSGKFRVAIQYNPTQNLSSLPPIASFPDGFDYLINSGSTLKALYYEKPAGWQRFTINHPNKDYLLLTFDRLGRCLEPQAGTNYGVQIYLQNQKVFRKYRYNYVIYVSSGGNIKLIRIRS